MALSEIQMEEWFFKALYQCGGGKLIDCSRMETILAASKIRQDSVYERINDETKTVKCHKNCVSWYVSQSTLGKVAKQVNNATQSDDSQSDPKQSRSSTGRMVF